MPKRKAVKATPKEHAEVSRRLRKSNPGMFKRDWVKDLKKGVRLLIGQEKHAYVETARTRDITKKLKRSGLTDAEIARFRGK